MSAVTESPLQPFMTWSDQWPTYDGYKPLNTGRREIRLIDLESSDSGVVSMRLRHASLDENPVYCALSYSWGPPVTKPNQRVVLVNNVPVYVRPTLASFLHSLTSLTGPLTVWLDAISINQRDLEEKKEQVIMMGGIYSKALKTYAWLGMGSAETDYVCQSLTQTVVPVPDKAYGSYVQQILQRPYWDRMWIIQEYALSREIILVIGNYLVHVKEFQDRVPSKLWEPSILSTLNSTKDIPSRENGTSTPMERLRDLVHSHRNSQCSDKKDKVYSLLSLTDTTIKPDYTISPAQLVLRMIYEMGISCHDLLDDFAERRYAQYLHRLFLCIQPSMDDMFVTVQRQDIVFSRRLRSSRVIDSVQRLAGQIPIDYSGAWRFIDHCFHKSLSFDKTLHLFEISSRDFDRPVGFRRSPVPEFVVAVSDTGRQTMVGFTLHVIGMDDSSVLEGGNIFTAEDACLLAEILSKGIAVCNGVEIGEYAEFHVSQLVFVILSLFDAAEPYYNLNNPSLHESLQRFISCIEILRAFLNQLRKANFTSSQISCACDTPKAKTSSATTTSNSSTDIFLDDTGMPQWVIDLLLTGVDSPILDPMTPAQTLAEKGFLPCTVASDKTSSSMLTIYEGISSLWRPPPKAKRHKFGDFTPFPVPEHVS